MKKQQVFIINGPAQSFIPEREKFFAAHANAKIIDELKSIYMVMQQVPQDRALSKIPGLHIPAQQQMIPMVLCAIYFEEEVVENIFHDVKQNGSV